MSNGQGPHLIPGEQDPGTGPSFNEALKHQCWSLASLQLFGTCSLGSFAPTSHYVPGSQLNVDHTTIIGPFLLKEKQHFPIQHLALLSLLK